MLQIATVCSKRRYGFYSSAICPGIANICVGCSGILLFLMSLFIASIVIEAWSECMVQPKRIFGHLMVHLISGERWGEWWLDGLAAAVTWDMMQCRPHTFTVEMRSEKVRIPSLSIWKFGELLIKFQIYKLEVCCALNTRHFLGMFALGKIAAVVPCNLFF